jgi:multidrug resistance protein, MATE family
MPQTAPTDVSVRARHPLVELVSIAAPSVVTMTSYTVMQFIDSVMVSQIRPADPIHVAAQGNGGMAVWMSLSFGLGATGVVNTYVSQHLGRGRPEAGSPYAWATLWLSAAWVVLLVPYALLLPSLFRLMGHAPELVALETEYAQIAMLGAFFVLASRGIAHYFFGLHRPLVVMCSVLAANVLNVALNALLIFGDEGPPAWTPLAPQIRALAEALGIEPMGVAGAAWGTVIGAGLELLLPMLVFLSPRFNRRYRTRSAWRFSMAHQRDIFRLGWPAGLMFINEMLCWACLMTFMIPAGGAARARLLDLPPEELGRAVEAATTTANTAGWIALRYAHLSFMPAMGMSMAVTALVGRCMGMGRPDLAARRAWLGVGITVGYMAVCAVAFVVFRRELVEVFIPAELIRDKPEAAEAVLAVGGAAMIAAAIFQVFDAAGIVIGGALRGAGDTVWPGVVTVALSWAGIVGLGSALIWLAPGLGAMGPWIGASAYLTVLGLLLTWRFARGRWRSIDVLGRSAASRARDDFDDLPAPTEALAGHAPGQA